MKRARFYAGGLVNESAQLLAPMLALHLTAPVHRTKKISSSTAATQQLKLRKKGAHGQRISAKREH